MSDHLNLQSISVVVTANSYNPSILNPDFLSLKGIVPDDWEVIETLTTPTVSFVRYKNGISWLIDKSRLKVSEEVGQEFKDHYHIHQAVKAYLNTFPNTPYQSLGLNFQVSIYVSHPQIHLIKRFGADWISAEEGILEMIPSFKLQAEDVICFIKVLNTSLKMGEIVVECNIHHQDLLNSIDLCSAISRWPERQVFIQNAIHRLFEI